MLFLSIVVVLLGDVRSSQVANFMNVNYAMPTDVTISGTGISTTKPYIATSELENYSIYTVTPTYSSTTGYITEITVEKFFYKQK